MQRLESLQHWRLQPLLLATRLSPSVRAELTGFWAESVSPTSCLELSCCLCWKVLSFHTSWQGGVRIDVRPCCGLEWRSGGAADSQQREGGQGRQAGPTSQSGAADIESLKKETLSVIYLFLPHWTLQDGSQSNLEQNRTNWNCLTVSRAAAVCSQARKNREIIVSVGYYSE